MGFVEYIVIYDLNVRCLTLDKIPPAIECTLSSDLPVAPLPTPYIEINYDYIHYVTEKLH